MGMFSLQRCLHDGVFETRNDEVWSSRVYYSFFSFSTVIYIVSLDRF
jgi:hypothetical protein